MFYSLIINQYLPASGVIVGEGSFVFPVGGNWRETSPFGPRIHPVTGVHSFHRGIDLVTDIACSNLCHCRWQYCFFWLGKWIWKLCCGSAGQDNI